MEPGSQTQPECGAWGEMCFISHDDERMQESCNRFRTGGEASYWLLISLLRISSTFREHHAPREVPQRYTLRPFPEVDEITPPASQPRSFEPFVDVFYTAAKISQSQRYRPL